MRRLVLLIPLTVLAVGCESDDGHMMDDEARQKAANLVAYAREYTRRHDGAEITRLADLAPYSEVGDKCLRDPWGAEFRFKHVDDEAKGRRLVVWTVNPRTKAKLAVPKELADHTGD